MSRAHTQWITESPIEEQALICAITSAECGAIVTFDGRVRNHSHGESVTHLVYECYEAMVGKIFERIEKDCGKKWPMCRVAFQHRVGTLQIGDSAVFIAVASPHRSEAYECNRFIIESIKDDAPIWKQEYLANGSRWVSDRA